MKRKKVFVCLSETETEVSRIFPSFHSLVCQHIIFFRENQVTNYGVTQNLEVLFIY